MQRPGPEDFCAHDRFEDDPDTKGALLEFLGLTVRQAETHFAYNYYCRYESLWYMGPKAFCYYVYAALRHMTGDWNEDTKPDNVVLSAFISAIEYQLSERPDRIVLVVPVLRKAMRQILDDWSSYVAPDADADEYTTCELELRARGVALSARLDAIDNAAAQDDPRELAEILQDAADASDREPDCLHPVERQMLQAIVRVTESGSRVASEDEALALIAPADVASARKVPSYFAAFPMLRRQGLLAWFQDEHGRWRLEATEAGLERLRGENDGT